MMRPRRTAATLVVWALSLLPCASCGAFDPVHQSQVDALGPETGGIPTGPYHRAGQQCTVCHGPEGPAHPEFVLAGTVFDSRDRTVGVDQAELLMVDSLGSSPPTNILTNCVGNFYVTADTWNPAFPIRVAIASKTSTSQMIGHIGRAGSCATCHTDPKGLDSAGHVFVASMPSPNATSCPVNPVLGAP